MNPARYNNEPPRVKVSALLSAAEAEALQKLLENLTPEHCRKLADNDGEANAFIDAAMKMRRQLVAAEMLPAMPAYDD
ncbi:MAG: hypothetical protein AAFR58_03225 [Cyanobacteria bacterium J06627_28]